ncbi:ferredoxin [Sphingomonadales bacterium 56]|uniref:Ferredoxin n=6 Tax=Alphaproteobacteria TaxID=28211 RepID=A0A2S8B027_9SPHN|nr:MULTISPECIES: ferredoxin [Sphingobium]AGH51648.1 putative ferredoxin [Sphingomonas sp. MM-1]MBY2930660.1 ferredoxin [Sphingomonadales bacterium 56]MBY2960652.1 ferredoxin [Sphingomonadales bacterium 58]PQM25713.1 ferredoxin [Sphingopyxis lindanitolerans]CAD7341648.1 Ferredoxin fas2 [Sphingobium sp. S8]
MMQVKTLPERCVSSGQCVMLAPGVFDQDDDGVVLLLRDTVDDGDEASVAAVRSSANVCPAAAIRLSATPKA